MGTAKEVYEVLKSEGFDVSMHTCKELRRLAGIIDRANEAQANGHPAMGMAHIPIKEANELQAKFAARWDKREERA